MNKRRQIELETPVLLYDYYYFRFSMLSGRVIFFTFLVKGSYVRIRTFFSQRTRKHSLVLRRALHAYQVITNLLLSETPQATCIEDDLDSVREAEML